MSPEQNLSPLVVKDVSKFYGDFCALCGISFEVKEGEVFGLLGPNGAGKSSLISMITTLSSVTCGSISTFGHDVTQNSIKAKMNVGVVPQELIVHGYFSLREILLYHSGYYGLLNNHKRVDYLLERLGLWEHRNKSVRELSGGMKRRMLIVKALVHSPKLLLLDEPTAGVDVELRRSLWDFVKELNESGVSVLLTTHYLEEAEELCGRVAIIHKGKLQKLGRTKEIVKEFTQRELIIRFKDPSFALNSVYFIKKLGEELVFKIPSDMGVGEFLETQKIPLNLIKDLNIKEGSLEEAFEKVVGGHE
jgi:ABC-2 type transport system ATP-binding protein